MWNQQHYTNDTALHPGILHRYGCLHRLSRVMKPWIFPATKSDDVLKLVTSALMSQPFFGLKKNTSVGCHRFHGYICILNIKYIYMYIYIIYTYLSLYIYMDMPHVAHQLAISKSIFQVNLNPTVDFFPPWSLRIRPKNHWNYPPLMQKQGLVASRCHLDVSKNRGKTPKMDGLMVYNGKPYKNGWFRVALFLETPIYENRPG